MHVWKYMYFVSSNKITPDILTLIWRTYLKHWTFLGLGVARLDGHHFHYRVVLIGLLIRYPQLHDFRLIRSMGFRVRQVPHLLACRSRLWRWGRRSHLARGFALGKRRLFTSSRHDLRIFATRSGVPYCKESKFLN